MPQTVKITVHSSEFPQSVERAFLEGLRARKIAPRFLYQGHRQGQLWLRLHHEHSPAWRDPEVLALYAESFAAASMVRDEPVNVAGLGCGGGTKEAMLLLALAAGKNPAVAYLPSDVSLPLLLTSVESARNNGSSATCKPLLCDLALAEDLPAALDDLLEPSIPRIITFFGLIPNFEPEAILPKLSSLVRKRDVLLFSANLAPGTDYRAGVESIFGGYDNAHTRDWLMAFLEDLGVRSDDGMLKFSIEDAGGNLRIVADFQFSRERVVVAAGEKFVFERGAVVRLFFSYRYTAQMIPRLLRQYGLEARQQWIASSGEEGVFLCEKSAR